MGINNRFINSIKEYILLDLKYYGELGFKLECLIHFIIGIPNKMRSNKYRINRQFKKIFGKTVNWDNPLTLNEKIQWLKIYGFEQFHTICADKFRVREYLRKKFGNDDFQIPVLYTTNNWKDITLDIIPDCPCVVKANHTQGDVWIIKDKKSLNIKRLRTNCRWALRRNLYESTLEPQYKDIRPLIIIEKLLQTKDGYIPNDYKLHFINGKLEFVYCSVGRETINKRNIYDDNWKPLMFSWSEKYKDPSTLRGPEIEAPKSFEKMKELGGEIAKDFKYVRVDFYDVDGQLFFGEITLHHGSGFDVFVPNYYDELYGNKLSLL